MCLRSCLRWNADAMLPAIQAAAYLAPTSETTTAVNAWLSENNITSRTLNDAGDWLAISVPVSQANELFDADFSVYTHDATGDQSIRTLSYSLPTELVGHLQLVHPTTTFTQPSAKLPLQKERYNGTLAKRQSACSSYIDPNCLQQIYGIPTSAIVNSDPLVVTGYSSQWPSPSDMSVRNLSCLLRYSLHIRRDNQTFLSNYRPDIPSTTTWSTYGLDNGTWDPSDPGDEAVLPLCPRCLESQ